MKKAYMYLLLFCISACAGRRIQPGEEALANDRSGKSWWMVSAVSSDASGIHLSLLMMPDRVEGKPFAACFASVWSETDSSFSYGICLTDSFITGKEGKKLFSATLYADAPGHDWYWNLSRSSALLKAALHPGGGSRSTDTTMLKFVHPFHKQKTFRAEEMDMDVKTWMVAPLSSREGKTTIGDMSFSGWLHLRVLKGGKDWLFPEGGLSQSAPDMSWLELDTGNGGHLTVMLKTGAQPNTKTVRAVWMDEQGNFSAEEAEMEAITAGRWKSAASGNMYALEYVLKVPSLNLNLRITPRMKDQEIPMKKSSFWMGAVEAADAITGQERGKGNMFIFSRQ